MSEESVGIVETQYLTFAEPPNRMELDSGQQLGPITLAYETYGELNAERNNAILITHALSGDAHVAGYHSKSDRKPGWWDTMVGPGKAFDTRKYFIICSNVIGGCQGSTGPSSVKPGTGKPYALEFPIITIGDMVKAQRVLVRHLGIEKLLAVAGGSMGGMQALEWATRFPDEVEGIMCIASTHYSGAQQIAWDAVGRHAIEADHNFNGGQYYDGPHPEKGLAIARMLAHITYLSEESMKNKFGRTLRHADALSFDFDSEFSVETYLDYQGEQFVNRFDANSYLYITKAMDYFDLSARYGSLDAAMARVKARMLVLSYTSDWLYPPYQSRQIVYALARQNKNVTYCNIESQYGHDAFLLEVDVMRKIITGFLEHTADPEKKKRQQLTADSETEVVQPLISDSIFDGHRVDHDMIVDLVPEGSRVLDIGCGDGELLCRLVREKNVDAVGLELHQGNVVTCVRRGLSVIHANAEKGLAELPDQSFDYVICSMTLQVLSKPEEALRQMMRVGRKCVVSIPNFGHWKVRRSVLFEGRAPVTRNLPYSWNRTPNRYVLSVLDFRRFCEHLKIKIHKEIALGDRGEVKLWPNLFALEAVYVISSAEATEK
jgi:homoserine O-acetyltransferase